MGDLDLGARASGGAPAAVPDPRYSAPEVLAGGAGGFGPAADVYSLGCVIWELVSGQVRQTLMIHIVVVRLIKTVRRGCVATWSQLCRVMFSGRGRQCWRG